MSGTAFDDDPALRRAARELLSAHNKVVSGEEAEKASESDIRRKIGNLLVAAELVAEEDLVLEANRTDLSTPTLIMEVKRRIGRGIEPSPNHLGQLDGYLESAGERDEPMRLGVLSDGKHWVLRLPSEKGASARTQKPYSFTLQSAESAGDWMVWLEERTQIFGQGRKPPTAEVLKAAFGGSSQSEEMLARLRKLYTDNGSAPTVRVKRELWEQLLGTALGEVVEAEEGLDDLFVRHTYLASVVALSLQSAFLMDIEARAASDAKALIDGRAFTAAVGVRGVVESDFFGWVTEVDGGNQWIRDMAAWVSRYDWEQVDYDMARVLYQSVVTADERKRLGEYYTPDWLAEAVVDAVVDDPLSQRVLDPSCGSGTFLRAVIAAHIRAAKSAKQPPEDTLRGLRSCVIGMDIHPVAVHLARATWVHAARDVIASVPAGTDLLSELSVPVYLGDSLQLRTNADALFAQDRISIEVESGTDRSSLWLNFPKDFSGRADEFDGFMLETAASIEAGKDPTDSVGTLNVPEAGRSILEETLGKLKALHDKGQNHIWAYYTRNLVRPVWLSANKVDRIVGNPPWLAYNQTRSTIRSALERLAKQEYGIWPEKPYVTHADLAGLFYSRCLLLYLQQGGRMGMVMPHSALAAGQYEKWRKGGWSVGLADLSEMPWDLEQLEPNDFFPVPASVVFAAQSGVQKALPSEKLQWRGPAGGPNTKHKTAITGSDSGFQSPYAERAVNGATIFPRLLFFVTAEPSKASLVQGISIVSPVRSSSEKLPWKGLDPQELRSQSVEAETIFNVHRGDTIAPFLLLEPAPAVLPIAGGKLDPAKLPFRAKARWNAIDDIWETHKGKHSKLGLLEQLDYMGKLTRQLDPAPVRLLYPQAGRATAAVCQDPEAVIDYKLYWINCASTAEAHYLAAIINSNHLYVSVAPLMPKGQYGARDLMRHLWKLPIPAYDHENALHHELAEAGERAGNEAYKVWQTRKVERQEAGKATSSRAARDDIRRWLDGSEVGAEIETKVARLF